MLYLHDHVTTREILSKFVTLDREPGLWIRILRTIKMRIGILPLNKMRIQVMV